MSGMTTSGVDLLFVYRLIYGNGVLAIIGQISM